MKVRIKGGWKRALPYMSCGYLAALGTAALVHALSIENGFAAVLAGALILCSALQWVDAWLIDKLKECCDDLLACAEDHRQFAIDVANASTERDKWAQLTGTRDPTTKSLTDTVRAAIAAAEGNPFE